MKTNSPAYAALVALDWGDQEHAFALQSGALHETGTVAASAESLHQWLEQLARRFAAQPVALAIEAGKNAVLHALVAYPWLTVFPVHPATSERFRKAFTPSGAKSDLPDAEVLLAIVTQHRDQLRPLVLDTPETRALAALTEVRRGAVDHRTQLGNELRSTLKLYFPQALALCGDDLWTPLALDFLERWPELAALQRSKPATLHGFYTAHHSRRPEVIADRIALIQQARPLTTDRAVIAPAILQVQLLAAVLRPLQRHIVEVEAQIAATFAAHPEAHLYRALPGAGPALAPRLLVALGTDRSRYCDAPVSRSMPASLRSPSAVAGNSGSIGAGTPRSSCGRPSSSGPDRPSPNAPGPKPITSTKNAPANGIKRSCAASPSNGSASSGAAGRTAPRMTNRATSNHSSAKTPRSHTHSSSPDFPCPVALRCWLGIFYSPG